MEPSHYSYPYSNIAYKAGFDPKIFNGCPKLKQQDLYVYASLAMNNDPNSSPYTGDPIVYLADSLNANPSTISIFKTPITDDISHAGKLSYAHDTNKLYEPLIGKLVDPNSPLTFVSHVFPLGSIDRHTYEYVYFAETGFEARDDQVLHDLLSTPTDEWINLDLLKCDGNPNPNHSFIDSKNKIASSSRKRFESVLMVINSIRQNIKTAKGSGVVKQVKAGKAVTRKALPKKLRMDLWEKHFPSQRKGKCFTCESEIDILAFEAGHINPVALGGLDDISNLLPLCQPCNRSMSSHHMIEWARQYYPNAPALSSTRTKSLSVTDFVQLDEQKANISSEQPSLTKFLADIMAQIKAQYPSPYQVYDRLFFEPGKGKIDVKKYKSKFGHWFNSLLPIVEGPDGIKYQFVTDKDLFDVIPPGDVSPNENWKNIRKNNITGKVLPVSWIYNLDLKIFRELNDYTMWGYINSKDFPFVHKVGSKCGSASVTKSYNTRLESSLKDDPVINILKYTPIEFTIVVNIARHWNISYAERNFINIAKV